MNCGGDSQCNSQKIIYMWKIQSKIFLPKKITSVQVEGEW